MDVNKIYQGDCLEVLKTFPDNCVDVCVTSPPYFGLRDYGNEGQCGLEETPELYVSKMVEVFTEVRRVLKPAGTLWLNLGDSYSGSWGNYGGQNRGNGTQRDINNGSAAHQKSYDGLENFKPATANKHSDLKPKDLIGIPWMVAFALRSSGWYLRQDIIWSKPNPMPESVTDRCTKAHEYIFLMSKSSKYYYDNQAIGSEILETTSKRYERAWNGDGERGYPNGPQNHIQKFMDPNNEKREWANKRSVWTVNTMSYSEAHFATFPERLIVDMIKAGCPEEVCNKCGKAREKIMENKNVLHGDKNIIGNMAANGVTRTTAGLNLKTAAEKVANYEFKGLTDCGCNAGFSPGIVLDPFSGAGTTALVSRKLNRNYIGIELNEAYIKLSNKRLNEHLGMFI